MDVGDGAPPEHPIIPGAEPLAVDAGDCGVLVLHGFTGNPGSVRPLADAFVAAGFSVRMPLLPGHGTVVADLMNTEWSDWLDAADSAYRALAARCTSVVVAGLSMGGALALFLAARHREISALICVNPAVRVPPGARSILEELVDSGQEIMAGLGSDIADPTQVETAYPDTPLGPLLSMFDAEESRPFEFADLVAPLLLFTSRQDHVVSPGDSEYLASVYGGRVEHVWLERSYHVATRDFDRDLLVERAVRFVDEVLAAERPPRAEP